MESNLKTTIFNINQFRMSIHACAAHLFNFDYGSNLTG